MITDFPTWLMARSKRHYGSSKTRRNQSGRDRRRTRLALEMLEPRLVLSTITWSTTAAPTGGDWNQGSNWVGGNAPGPSDTAVIKGLTGSGTVYMSSGASDTINGLTTDSTAHLDVISGSLSLGVDSASTIGGSMTIELGASMSFGAAATVQVAYDQTITDNGTLSFATGDKFSFQNTSSQVIVDGTLSATATTFTGSGNSNIFVNSGGTLTPTSSTFNLPVFVQYNNVPSLAGNVSFEQVNINPTTLPTNTTLNLSSLGTNTANFSYNFPSGFTIAIGATVDVAANVGVTMPYNQTITDNGTLSFASGDSFDFTNTDSQIVVGGTLSATNTTFNGYAASNISVNSGGTLTPTGCTFNLPIFVQYNNVPSLAGNVSFEQVNINPATLPTNTTLNLSSLGINTANFSYNLPDGFTIAIGATVDVAANVPVTMPYDQTITDNGTLSFTSGDSFDFTNTSSQIVVGGTLSATATTFNGYGNSNISVNSGGTLTPTSSTFNLPIFVQYANVPSLANNVSFEQVNINPATLPTNTTLNLNSLGTNTANFSYNFPSGFTIAIGATVDVAANVPVTMPYDQTITDNGTLSFTSGDSFDFTNTSSQIVVGGTLSATATTFNGYGNSNISVNSGGTLTPTSSTFNLPIFVQYANVPSLAGNVSFEQVNINPATLPTNTTLNLNSLGTNTANFSYNFPSGFTIAIGATVDVAANVPVTMPYDQTITDNGTLSFTSGDSFDFTNTSSQIVVGGTLSAAATTFNGYGNSNISVNSGGTLTPTSSTFNLPIFVQYNNVASLANNVSFEQVNINAATLPGGTTLNLNSLGSNTTNFTYNLPNGFTIALNATLAFGPNVPVTMAYAQTLTDNGTLSFASGDTFSFQNTAAQIVVGGTLSATATTFNGYGNSNIFVNSGGNLTPTDSTFNLPIFVQYNNVPSLAGNVSFEQVNINDGILPAPTTLSLNLIGTNTSSLSYNFPSGFNVAAGATIAVGANVSVSIVNSQTIVDNGTLSFSVDDTLTFLGGNSQITVGGALTANATTFTGPSNANITVNAGGNLTITSSTYASGLKLNPNSTDSVFDNVFSGTLTVDSAANTGTQANPTITGNDFTGVGNNGVVATGDPNASIYLTGNYWGTTTPTQIDAKILDHNDSPVGTRPTIVYQPFVSGASGTVATPVVTPFSTSSQVLNLTATVSTTAGVAINTGTETFTVLSGTQAIGQTTAPANVSNGQVTTQYTLPAGTAAGQYFIEANYSGSTSYLPSTDALHYLTVNPAATNTTVGTVSTGFSAAQDQTLTLNAQVASTGGTVSEGIVTFTILRGGNPVGSSVIGSVTGDTASASYDLLAGTPGGNYTIEAVYTDPVDFKTSTVFNQLTVTAAATTVAVSGSSATFSEISGEGTSLSATVSSSAGTSNEGSVTFTILNGSTQIAGPFVMSVANGTAGGIVSVSAGTAVGSYIIAAVYNGTASYAASLESTSNLVVSAAATTTAAAAASTQFSAAGQSVPLSAIVTSMAGLVDDGGKVTFTILNGSTPVGQPVSATVSAGSGNASYSLPAGTPVGTYTIRAVYTDAGNFVGSVDTSHFLTVTQPAPFKLFLETPPSGTATAGTAFTTQPVVYEEDQNGNLETGDNSTIVTVSLASGSGPPTGTLTATVSGGIATFTNLGDNTAETISLKFSSGNLATATSGNIVVSPAAASKLIATQQPTSATAGAPFTIQPIVKEEDPYGNVITTDSTHTVTVARGAVGTAALQGSNLTVTLASGVGTFSGLFYDKAEAMNLAFTTNATGVSAATSSNITVSPSAASQLIINQQPSATATAGQPLATQPVVYEEDPFNNLLTSDNTTVVTAMLNSGVGPLQGTASATVSGGVAHFNNLSDNLAETISLKFTSGTLASSPTNAITISPASTGELVIQTQPSTTATAGQSLAIAPVIYLEDASGNLETSDNSTMVTVSFASGSGTLQGTKSVTVVHGVATFAGLSDTKAETISLKFSANGLTAGPSNNIVVSPAAAYQLLIHTQPSSAATAGQAFATQPSVYEVDQYGNIETSDSSTPITASLASGNGPLAGTTTANVSGGVATFVGLADNRAGMISLNFSGAGLTAGPSNNVFISPGPAAGLVIQTPPYAQVIAGNPLTDPIVINEVDQYGNIETGDNSTVVTASQASGAGSLKGTMTATVSDGVASFNSLENDTAGALTLQFSAASLPPVISAPSTVTPAPATHLVISQPPAGVSAGAPFALTLEAEDNFGNVDTSYDGPMAVALASGSSGSLTGTASMMASAGVATFANLVDNTSGPISLNATSGTLPDASTGTVTITSAQAAKLVIQTQPSQSATAGSALATQPVIYEEDQYGNILTADNSTVVTAYLGSGGGLLGGTVAATLSHGVATFTNLTDQTAGNVTLEFTGAGLTSIPSVPIQINPAAASKLVIQTQPSASAAAAQAFETQPVIALVDSFGNIETNDNNTQVTASLSSGIGPLSGTTTVTVKNGVATFSNLTDDKAETIALSFAGAGLTVGPSTSIVVTPAPSKLVIHTEPLATATAGQPFSFQPVIYEEDSFGNLITSDNSTVVTVSLTAGAGPLQGTTSVTMTGGVATFTNLADDSAETISLGFSGGGFTVGPAPSISVAAAAPSKLVIHTQPAETATAGTAFTTQPVVVYEEDRFGNLETADNSTLITAALASGVGPLHGTTAVALSGGVATFNDLIDNLAESITLDFVGNGLTSSPSVPIAVSPTTVSKLVLSKAPSLTATAGQPFATQPVVSLEDQYGNVESGDNSTAVTVSLTRGAGPLQGSSSVTVTNGIATFANLAYDTAESISFSFTAAGLSVAPASNTAVSPAFASKLVIHAQPSSTAVAGQAFAIQPVVYEEDQYGNIEAGDNSTTVTASLQSGTGPLSGTKSVTLTDGVATFVGLD